MAAYFNAGQDCTAATRVLAGPGVHADFLDALVEQARGTTVGTVRAGRRRLWAAQQRGPARQGRRDFCSVPGHAQVLTGGEQVGDAWLLLRPTVVVRPAPGRRNGAAERYSGRS